jgi:hypothetical protein
MFYKTIVISPSSDDMGLVTLPLTNAIVPRPLGLHTGGAAGRSQWDFGVVLSCLNPSEGRANRKQGLKPTWVYGDESKNHSNPT